MADFPFSYESLTAELEALAAASPCLSFASLGQSICGRQIPLLRLGHGSHGVLYCAAHHGSEWLTAGLLAAFAREYCRAHSERQSVCSINVPYLANTRSIWLLPILNPDGMVLAQTGKDDRNPLVPAADHGTYLTYRGNARGVDLNRNFDAGFETVRRQVPDAARPVCGEHPESEPETAALCTFIRAHAPFDMLISFHTAGEEIYWDYENDASPRQRNLAGILSRLCGYPTARPAPDARHGGLKDWYRKEYGAPAFTVECGPGQTPLDPAQLPSLYERLRPLLFTAAVLGTAD